MRWLFLALTLAALSAETSASLALWKKDRVTLLKEEAVIRWDEKSKSQTLELTVELDGAQDVGFVVPVPAVPEPVTTGWYGFPQFVDDMQASRREEALRDPAGAAEPDKTSETPKFRGSLGQIVAASSDLTILSAEKPEPLLAWIKSRGYILRPEVKKWMAAYQRPGWRFAAYRLWGPRPTLRALRLGLKFPTERGFFPYRMPMDTVFRYGFRPVHLVVVGSEPMRWDTENRLDPGLRLLGRSVVIKDQGVATEFKMDAVGDINQDWLLSRDPSAREPMTEAEKQEILNPPAKTDFTWIIWMGAGLLLLVGAGLALARRQRR